MSPDFFVTAGELTVADLAATGVLHALAEYLHEPGAAQEFLVHCGFPVGRIGYFNDADGFWRFHVDKIAQGIVPGGLTAFARHVFARFPLIREHAERHGLVLPPEPPREPPPLLDAILPIATGLTAGNLQLEAVVTAARRAARRDGHPNRVVDPISLGGLSDPTRAAGELVGHVKRLDPTALIVLGKPDPGVRDLLTALPPGLLKERLVITHGVFTTHELRVCGTLAAGVLAANSLFPDEVERFAFEATHKLFREGATLLETLDACRETLHGVGHDPRSSESLQDLLMVATPEGKSPAQIRPGQLGFTRANCYSEHDPEHRNFHPSIMNSTPAPANADEFAAGMAEGLDPSAAAADGPCVTSIDSPWLGLRCHQCGHTFRIGDRIEFDTDRRPLHASNDLACAPGTRQETIPADIAADFIAGMESAIDLTAGPRTTVLIPGHPLLARPVGNFRRPYCRICSHSFRPFEVVVICPCQPTNPVCERAYHHDPSRGLLCFDMSVEAKTPCPLRPGAKS